LFRQAIFFLNRQCPVNCYSCNVGCNNNITDILTPEWFDNFIKIYKRLNFKKYIILTGGEPFLTFDSLKRAVYLFNKFDFQMEILTSGIWFKKSPHFLDELKEIGNFTLRISLDYEHEKIINLKTISKLILYSQKLGITPHFTIREVPNVPNNLKYYKIFLKNVSPSFFEKNIKNSRWLHMIPHINLPKRKLDTKTGKNIRKKCFLGFKDLIIGSDSLLYPCCGLFTLPNHKMMTIGNPLQLSYKEIIEIFNNKKLFLDLQNKGPYKMAEEIYLKDYECSTICEICLKTLTKILET